MTDAFPSLFHFRPGYGVYLDNWPLICINLRIATELRISMEEDCGPNVCIAPDLVNVC